MDLLKLIHLEQKLTEHTTLEELRTSIKECMKVELLFFLPNGSPAPKGMTINEFKKLSNKEDASIVDLFNLR